MELVELRGDDPALVAGIALFSVLTGYVAQKLIGSPSSGAASGDDAGDAPWLYYVKAETKGCGTANRVLVRERMKLARGGRR